MLELHQTLSFYKRIDIREAIIAAAQDKEIATRYGDGGFGKRPDVLFFPNDVLDAAKNKASSFHASEELWTNPLQLRPGMPRQEMDALRKGWDLILDIDCKSLDYSRIAADLLVEAIQYHGIKSVSIKFSGNHGFHIGIPFEAFPSTVQGKATKNLFPEAPRRIAGFLKDFIHDHLEKAILEFEDITMVGRRFGKSFNEIVRDGKFDPYTILEIDTILLSSRHLYRMSYSFNEKSGLVSVPIPPGKAKEFSLEDAKPENVKISEHVFLDTSNLISSEANRLIIAAFDHRPKIEENQKAKKKYDEFEEFQEAAPQEHFPPCMKKILAGLEDGKKRSMFILTNFLSCVGYSNDAIGDVLHKWNKRNPAPLREVLIEGQVRYHKSRSKTAKPILPPNCNNMMYYKEMGICKPDGLCAKIKNPVHYVRRRSWIAEQANKGKRGKKTKKKETRTTKSEPKMPISPILDDSSVKSPQSL